ncbi:maleylpyruvate isomerase N-terminal domain-containing protein [Streptomyces sp. NBC_01497]|uniref:maleylpyruvate isomerase N-terminal domain-containing protein n=1 Tax=Streptomyces sp. NBC_01497 TaxID=2903885 RepID=UPI002E30DAC4|nr:maleylpyruvate isomerase N-terminal domain-containing protein [Streptomyces sp. NBC_01497]
MTPLTHERHCDEIVEQADALCALLDDAGPAALGRRVPTCPDWNTEQLVRHLGESLRWIWHLVEQRGQEDPPRRDVPGVDGPGDAGELTGWLAGSARLLAGALRSAGPAAVVWSWAWDASTGFWARRMCHEVLVHRADAVFALHGIDTALGAYRVEPALAADALDEWLRIVEFTAATENAPGPSGGATGTLRMQAADVPGAEWLIEIDGPRVRRRHAHEKADAAVRAPLTALLLGAVRRLPPRAALFEVTGDRGLLESWLDTATFG